MPSFAISPPSSRVRSRARGFTLIEVLVAVLVLSFGMLGVVGLQVSAMQANKEAKKQSSAVRYARELAEAMRANRTVLPLPTAQNAYLGDFTSSAPPATFNCPANSASAPLCATHYDLSKQDVSDWFTRASNEIPGLRAVVCADSNPYDSSNVATWTCTTPAATAAGTSLFIKLAWPQQNTNRAASSALFSSNSIPLIVVPVIN